MLATLYGYVEAAHPIDGGFVAVGFEHIEGVECRGGVSGDDGGDGLLTNTGDASNFRLRHLLAGQVEHFNLFGDAGVFACGPFCGRGPAASWGERR